MFCDSIASKVVTTMQRTHGEQPPRNVGSLFCVQNKWKCKVFVPVLSSHLQCRATVS
jgi:hypothetical protein